MAKKTGKKLNVNVEVEMDNINNIDDIMNSVETAQRENSIWAEFSKETAIASMLGAAIQHKMYKTGADIAIHLKLVFANDQEKVRIATIRGFFKKNPETGKLDQKGIAFRNAIQLIANQGVKINKIHAIEDNPNLSTFDGWTELPEALVVSITTREFAGRFWPNTIKLYNPIQMNANELFENIVGGDAQ